MTDSKEPLPGMSEEEWRRLETQAAGNHAVDIRRLQESNAGIMKDIGRAANDAVVKVFREEYERIYGTPAPEDMNREQLTDAVMDERGIPRQPLNPEGGE